ncbi:MAG: GNAT family N-acetyltransferase [Candidatus Thermoplasmatota archaeon]|jgi:RimJ/RimL family protein N-acetyltransferase|nr:GNAT family N-acetyltransferase [Candidatus Thermoplasmatota archaeon]MCL5794631.1 GNAT family N-acetyltransferase [Candidatus Thermoplasmatota archaeon]
MISDRMSFLKARIDDREEILSFCQDTWQSGIYSQLPHEPDEITRETMHEYIDSAIDQWINQGTLYKTVVNEEIAGILNVEVLDDDTVWMGGLRVKESFRRLGIASATTLSAVNLYRSHKRFRISIFSWNEPSLGLARKMRFKEIAEICFLKPEYAKETYDSNILCTVNTPSAFFIDWKYFVPSKHTLSRLKEEGRILENDAGSAYLDINASPAGLSYASVLKANNFAGIVEKICKRVRNGRVLFMQECRRNWTPAQFPNVKLVVMELVP